MSKKRIAILAAYPVWQVDETLPGKSNHYAVWLTALHKFFETWHDKEIHWITLSKGIHTPRTYHKGGQYFHVLPCGSRTLAQYLSYYPDRWKISRYLKKLTPDLVHAWGTEECYALCAMDYPGLKLLSVQGLLTAYAERAPIANFERRQSRFEKKIFTKLPHITTESQWARERVLELAPKANVHLFEYAVEPEFFRSERHAAEKPCCLMLSSNTPVKNIPLAIEAFSQPALRHIKLYMAGVSPSAYKNLPDNIIPLGYVDRKQVIKLLSETWCLIHPSLADTGPTALKEARTMGVAAIATTDCGAKDYIIPGKSGFIISPHSAQQLTDAVLTITQDRDTAVSMGLYDQESCIQRLSEAAMTAKLRWLYSEILKG